jgi:hypothetical protein
MASPNPESPGQHDVLGVEWVAQGYAFVPFGAMRARLLEFGSLQDWDAFASSWNDLPLDAFMADHGRYRRRRHAVYAIDAGGNVARRPHEPHFQAVDYNPLNGGIERWFGPVLPEIGEGPTMHATLHLCRAVFGAAAGRLDTPWRVEVHQFRIEAQGDCPGQPTPEGMHRDGVDYVLVMMVRRCNIDEGTTLIGSPAGEFASSFTLVEPFDAAWVDDHRVHHGVTPVQALDPGAPAFRDVLVVTFRRQ